MNQPVFLQEQSRTFVKKQSMKKILFSLFTFAILGSNAQNYSWAGSISGSANEVCNSISKDANGNVYVAGYFEGSVDFDPNPNISSIKSSAGSRDLFMAKYDNAGIHQWSVRMGSTGVDEAKFIKVNPTNGDIYLVGTFQNTVDFDFGSPTATLSAAGGYDIFFARYSAAGSLLYARRIGNTNIELVDAVDINSSGELIMLGRFTGTVDFNPNSGVYNLVANGSEAFIASYSNTFNLQQAYKFGPGSLYPKDVCYDNSGANIYVTGGFNGTVDADLGSSTTNIVAASLNNDAFLIKYNSSISFQWAIALSGTLGSKEGRSVCVDNSNNPYITGSYSGTIDVNPGSPVTTFTSVANSTDLFMGGYSSSSGSYLGAYTIGGTGTDYGTSVVFNSNNELFLAGIYQSTVDLDPTNSTDIQVAQGTDASFFSKYSSSMVFTYAKTLNTTGSMIIGDLVLTAPNTVNVCGYFTGVSDFDPSAGVAQITAAGQYDGCFARYEECVLPSLPTSMASINNPCAGETVTLTLASGSLGGGIAYTWYAGGCGSVQVGTGTMIVVSPTVSTTYYVRSEGGCLTSPGPCSGMNQVDVTPNPTLNFSTSHSTLCAGESATLSIGGASSYSVNGISIQSNTYVVNPVATTVYTITGQDQCSASGTFTQTVDACLGLKSYSGQQIEIYPNPAKSVIYITCTFKPQLIVLKDMTGKTLKNVTETQLSVEDLSEGVYIMEVYHPEGRIVSKIVVTK